MVLAQTTTSVTSPRLILNGTSASSTCGANSNNDSHHGGSQLHAASRWVDDFHADVLERALKATHQELASATRHAHQVQLLAKEPRDAQVRDAQVRIVAATQNLSRDTLANRHFDGHAEVQGCQDQGQQFAG